MPLLDHDQLFRFRLRQSTVRIRVSLFQPMGVIKDHLREAFIQVVDLLGVVFIAPDKRLVTAV